MCSSDQNTSLELCFYLEIVNMTSLNRFLCRNAEIKAKIRWNNLYTAVEWAQ